MSIFNDLNIYLSKNKDIDINKCVSSFFLETAKENFDKKILVEELYDELNNIAKTHSSVALTLFIAFLRKQVTEQWLHYPAEISKNFPLIKRFISDVLSNEDSLCKKSLEKKLNKNNRFAFVMPWLPSNLNNNMANLVLAYIAGMQKTNKEVRLFLTGELVACREPSNTWSEKEKNNHRKIIESYGGNSEAIIYFDHGETLISKFLNKILHFDPCAIIVPNFELTFSYANLLRKFFITIFIQTSIKNSAVYDFDYFLTCGKKAVLPKNISRGAPVFLHEWGYPMFGFSKKYAVTEIKKKREKKNDFILLFASNRAENELDEAFLKKVVEFMNIVTKAKFNILGVKDKNFLKKYKFINSGIAERITIHGYLENIGDYLAEADVYVNPNRTGGGVSLALSLYANTPILLTGPSDARNFIDDFGYFDSYELMFDFLREIEINSNKYKNFRDSQVENFLSNYTSDFGVKKLIDFVDNLNCFSTEDLD